MSTPSDVPQETLADSPQPHATLDPAPPSTTPSPLSPTPPDPRPAATPFSSLRELLDMIKFERYSVDRPWSNTKSRLFTIFKDDCEKFEPC